PAKFEGDRLRSKAKVGVATGLAWTSVGGKILYLEGVALPGGTGQLKLTGQLGSVMQESANAAHSYLRARFGGDSKYINFFTKTDVHIHIPAGSIPKDGPSAGIAMATVLMSLMTGVAINRKTAMTGEITLTGDVLPIGGLKDKVLAAHRAGIDTILIPASNEVDLEKLPKEVRKEIRFVPVTNINQVWAEVFPTVKCK
ncbi:endopeptidase La, partial [bacterium]|nr:endopeptidase La [bacterium]